MAKGTCDCCDARDVELSRGFVAGIETFACACCCGDEPPDQCPDCGTRYPCKPGCPAMLLGPYTEDPENKTLMERIKGK